MTRYLTPGTTEDWKDHSSSRIREGSFTLNRWQAGCNDGENPLKPSLRSFGCVVGLGASHEIRYFWASHVVHHSSQKYNLSTALRQTWTGELSGSFLLTRWIPLVGFHPIMVAIFGSISLIYQFWIDIEAIGKLWRPVELVFNTPSHHRVYHGSGIKYLDRNHGGVLIIWDRLFGTFCAEEERPTYGLVTHIDTHNPLRIATHEWSALIQDVWRAPDWRSRMGYLFGPPGWSQVEGLRPEHAMGGSSTFLLGPEPLDLGVYLPSYTQVNRRFRGLLIAPPQIIKERGDVSAAALYSSGFFPC